VSDAGVEAPRHVALALDPARPLHTAQAEGVVHDVPIVHVDAACIVVDKPAGLLSVPGRAEHLQDCVAARVQAQWPDALVVHRLDMATSGLLLFARGAAAQRRLSDAFAQRSVHKRYVAVVHGQVVGNEGTIDLPLRTDWPNRPRQEVNAEHGKPSLTRWRMIARDAAQDTTRLELTPLTGRSHQLRVHLLAIGHPILGDALYAPAGVLARAGRLLLHADALGFEHPVSGTRVAFESAAPF
jgi:tRNA pseudouridine32 synthase / 23S rRNA pseudouridine746 synthase